jgi:hypothetical protein
MIVVVCTFYRQTVRLRCSVLMLSPVKTREHTSTIVFAEMRPSNPFRDASGRLRLRRLSGEEGDGGDDCRIFEEEGEGGKDEFLPELWTAEELDCGFDAAEMERQLEETHKQTLESMDRAHAAQMERIELEREAALRKIRGERAAGRTVPRTYPQRPTAASTSTAGCLCAKSVSHSLSLILAATTASGADLARLADAVTAAHARTAGSARCVLGVCASSEGFDAAGVRRRYYELARLLHPDKNDGSFEEAFQRVGVAFSEIQDGVDRPPSEIAGQTHHSAEDERRRAEQVAALYDEVCRTIFGLFLGDAPFFS